MDRRASECAMGISNHSAMINRWNSFLNDLWGRSHDTCRSKLPTSQTDVFEVGKNDRLLCKHLDLVEENWDVASVKLANYQQNISQGYDKGIKNKEFIPGDFVLKKILGNTRDLAIGKLGPTYEGPYRVTSIVGVKAYWLKDLDERLVVRP